MRFIGIDPATKTGFVALSETGEVLVETEVKGKGVVEQGGISISQLVSLENQVYKLLLPEDEIVIEAAAMGTQRGVTTGMIHGGIRSMVHRKSLAFQLVNPLYTKKYVGVTGWTGEIGNKRRLNNAEQKKAIKKAVIEHFGYTHKSDNVIDAYIIARIARNLYRYREHLPLIDSERYQIEVIKSILGEEGAG